MPSDRRNSIMAKATGLIFSLFDVASARQVPFGIPQCVQCVLLGLTSIRLCVPFIFADSEKQAWGQVHWYLYLSTLKYTFLSTCTWTSVLLFLSHCICTCT